MAKSKMKTVKTMKVVKAPRPLYMTLMIWVVGPLLSLMFLETLILFTAGMIPTFVAYVIDPSKNKQITKTVGYANVTGVFIVALEMWTYNNSITKALDLLSDPENWLIMFGTASVGWILYFIMRPLVGTYLSVTFDVRRKKFKDTEERLIKEWGDEVKQNAPEIPPEMLEEDEKAIQAEMERAGTAPKQGKENPAPPSGNTGS